MKKQAKNSTIYKKIDFDAKDIILGMQRLKGERRKQTSIALEDSLLKELKKIANKKDIPYQILIRLLIADGIKRMKRAA